MKKTIEIKIGTDRHQLVKNQQGEGCGCARCSLHSMCNSLGTTDISLCHALERELDEWAQPFGTRFVLKK